MAKKLPRANSKKFKVFVPTFSTAPGQYSTSAFLARRVLCAAYLSAFLSVLVQAEGLFGCTGAFPSQVADSPLSVAAVLSAIALLAGIASGVGFVGTTSIERHAPLFFASLWLSFRVVCALAPKFWNATEDHMLLDLGVPLIFLSRGPDALQRVTRASISLLLVRACLTESALRVMGGCGAWRDFTALQEIQVAEPFPTGLAWYGQYLPNLAVHLICAFKLYVQVLLAPLALCPARCLAQPATILLVLASIFDSALASRGCLFLLIPCATVAVLDDRCVSRFCSWSLLEAWGCLDEAAASISTSNDSRSGSSASACSASGSGSGSGGSSSCNDSGCSHSGSPESSAAEEAAAATDVSSTAADACSSNCSAHKTADRELALAASFAASMRGEDEDDAALGGTFGSDCEEDKEEELKEREREESGGESTRSSTSYIGSHKEEQLDSSSLFEEDSEDDVSESLTPQRQEEPGAADDEASPSASKWGVAVADPSDLASSGEEGDSEGSQSSVGELDNMDEASSDSAAADTPQADATNVDECGGEGSEAQVQEQGEVFKHSSPSSPSGPAITPTATMVTTGSASTTTSTTSMSTPSSLAVVAVYLLVFIAAFGYLARDGSPEISRETASLLVFGAASIGAALGTFNLLLSLLDRSAWRVGAGGRAVTTISAMVLLAAYAAGLCQFVVDLKIVDGPLKVPTALSHLSNPFFLEQNYRVRCPHKDQRMDLAVHGFLGSEETGFQLIDVLTKYQPNTKGELRMTVVQPYTPRLDLELWRLAQSNVKATPRWLYPILSGLGRKEGAAAGLLTQPNEGLSSWLYQASPKYARAEQLQGVRLAKSTRSWSDRTMTNHRWWSKPAYKVLLEADLDFVDKIADRTKPREHCISAMWTLTFPVAEALLLALAVAFSAKLLLHEPKAR